MALVLESPSITKSHYSRSWSTLMQFVAHYTYVYSSQGQTIKYKCKDRDRQNKNQIKKACHTT